MTRILYDLKNKVVFYTTQSYPKAVKPSELKDFRRKKNLTQSQLATDLGVTVHAVQSWEQGKNPVPPVVEKHLLSQRDIGVPFDLMMEINEYAKEHGISFDEALFTVLRKGLKK